MSRKIAIIAFCMAFGWQFTMAQSLIPTVKDKQGTANAGSVSKATYTIGEAAPARPSASVSGTAPAAKAAPAKAKAPAKVLIPRLQREMPVARQSRGYLTSVRTNVHFRVNRTDLDHGYLDNAETLNEFMALVDSLGAGNLVSVEIVSKASPEGPLDRNNTLAEGRCKTLAGFISSEYPALAGKITASPDGESWDELREYVQKDINLSSGTRSAIFRIMDGERDLDKREATLKKIGSSPEVGNIYRYLFTNYFPLIRNTGIYIVKK